MMAALYREAAIILKRLERKKGSLKSLVFPPKKMNSCLSYQKKLYALTSQTLKYKTVIEEVMTMCKSFLKEQPKLSHHLCMILLYDLLLGKGIQCGGPMKRFILNHKADLLIAFKENTKRNSDSLLIGTSVPLPRYARVNILKTSRIEMEEKLINSGYELVSQEEFFSHCCRAHNTCDGLCRRFCNDDHIPDLFAFCSCAPLTETEFYTSGSIILQDKASCFPAFLLAPPPGSLVIDACAAPGNKSTHLAGLMNNNGIIQAFDKDPVRYKTLYNMVEKSGASCIFPRLKDFLKVAASDFTAVKYILVDPSCSGSGISSRIEYNDQPIDKERLQSLANFQFKILTHALNFPCVEKVVYSTCSVYEEENEFVVNKALKKFSKKFKLVYAFPEWKRRGHKVFQWGDYCLRTNEEDKTNGFFVAVFERIPVVPCNDEVTTTTQCVQKFDTQECKMMKKDKRKSRCLPVKKHKRNSRRLPVTSSR